MPKTITVEAGELLPRKFRYAAIQYHVHRSGRTEYSLSVDEYVDDPEGADIWTRPSKSGEHAARERAAFLDTRGGIRDT